MLRIKRPLAAVLVFCCATAASALPSGKTSAVAYHDLWRKLWEDHITWTRMVIVGVANLPEAATTAYTNRLLQNPADMGAALAPYFPESDVTELVGLITDHLVVAKQILDTVKAAGDPAALIETWRQNGRDIAEKMAEMNPTDWPVDVGDAMWQEHLTATLDEATAHLTGNFATDVVAYDRVHALALEMADFFSSGVIRTSAHFKNESCMP